MLGYVKRTGLYRLIATHDMQQARRVSDKTAFFNFGKLVDHGATPLPYPTSRNKSAPVSLRRPVEWFMHPA